MIHPLDCSALLFYSSFIAAQYADFVQKGLGHIMAQGKGVFIQKWLYLTTYYQFSLSDDLFQNLFLEMKKLEIEETKVTYFALVLKVIY